VDSLRVQVIRGALWRCKMEKEAKGKTSRESGGGYQGDGMTPGGVLMAISALVVLGASLVGQVGPASCRTGAGLKVASSF